MNIYELRARKGFVGCCSSRVHRIRIYKGEDILKEYEGWDINIPDDLYIINKYFNDNSSDIEYKEFYSNVKADYNDSDYNCKITIDLEINKLEELLEELFAYNDEVKDTEEEYSDKLSDINEQIKQINHYLDHYNDDDEDDIETETSYREDSSFDITKVNIQNANSRLINRKEKLELYIEEVDKKHEELDHARNLFSELMNDLKAQVNMIREKKKCYVMNFKNSIEKTRA